MAANLNIRNIIISLVILILLVFLGLGAIKVFSQKKGAIKVDTQARFELPDDEGEALREIDPCGEGPNWESANYTRDGPLYNSSLICNCCYPGVVKCHVFHQLHAKGKELCGKIPRSLATLPYLETADFTQNYLSGTMPPEWTTSMKNLNYLSLYANNLSGPIPIYVYWGNMASPVYVRLENSMYCGTVPPELAKLFNMEHLILAASCQVMFNGGFNSIINMHDYERGKQKENQLAVQYGPTLCSTGFKNCRHDPPNRFTIHGLWPNDTSPPINRTFDPGLLDGDLLNQLQEHWLGLNKSCTRNYDLWSNEWEKHGSHFYNGSNPGSQVEYFQNGVNLFLTREIDEALGNLSELGE